MFEKLSPASLLSILALVASVLVACQSPGSPAETPAAAPTKSAGPTAAPDANNAAQPATPQDDAAKHAPSDVKPGSYEDWCGEHEVPESICTLCNPSLIPEIKSKGDWCDAQGLPESV